MATPSLTPGMGAIPNMGPAGGTTFRTWAPHAKSVEVRVAFNGSSIRTSMAPEEGGYWSVDVPAASVGHHYKFLVNGTEEKIDPYARQTTHSVGEAIITRPLPKPEALAMLPWNELVIYELHSASFPDWPSKPERMLAAVAGDLWYLKELGVNAIELLPVAEFPTDTSWGYNPSHLFAVESAYGGPKQLRHLIDEAHKLGIAVIVDVVYNHLGPNDLSIWKYDGWPEDQDTGGIYFYNDWRGKTPWGPRPDYGRPEVRQYILDNIRMWLEEYGVDGLRFDATAYMRNVHGYNNDPGSDLPEAWSLLQRLNDEKDRLAPQKIMIAEDMKGNAWITKRTGEGGAGFNAQWDANFHHKALEVLARTSDGAGVEATPPRRPTAGRATHARRRA